MNAGAEREVQALDAAHARLVIESHCPLVSSASSIWRDMEATPNGALDAVTEALATLEQVDTEPLGFRTFRHPVYVSLIRFESIDQEEPRP